MSWYATNPALSSRGRFAFASMFAVSLFGPSHAQVPLSTYTDAKGYIDVQALTCGQLANTYQEDADYLAA